MFSDFQISKTMCRNYQCGVCGTMFQSSAHLKRHLLMHTGDTQFICKICDKGFTRSSGLETHLLIHTYKYSFICKVCDKGCLQSSELKKHMHTNQSANKILNTSINLKGHMLN